MKPKFVSSADLNKNVLMAIDPGVSGGIVIMRGSEILTQSLKNLPDSEIVSFLRANAGPGAVAYMEKVGGYIPKGEDGEQTGQPGSRMFTFGDANGYVRGVLDTLGIRRVMVLPQMWQRGIPGRKGTYWQRKQALRAHAAKLFPALDVTPEVADALGLLHYARFREYGANAGYSLPSAPAWLDRARSA